MYSFLQKALTTWIMKITRFDQAQYFIYSRMGRFFLGYKTQSDKWSLKQNCQNTSNSKEGILTEVL
jgi:hypothetical protein